MTGKKHIPVADLSILREGDKIRVVETYNEGSVTYLGKFDQGSSSLDTIGIRVADGTFATAWGPKSAGGIGRPTEVTIERTLELPTKLGAVILWSDNGATFREHALTLVKGTRVAFWNHPEFGAVGDDRAAAGYVRTLWEG